MNKCAVSGPTTQAILNAWETQDLEAVLEEIESTSNSAQVNCLRNEGFEAIGCSKKNRIFLVLAGKIFPVSISKNAKKAKKICPLF